MDKSNKVWLETQLDCILDADLNNSLKINTMQAAILRAICRRQKLNDFYPKQSYLARQCRTNRETICRNIPYLIEIGYLEKIRHPKSLQGKDMPYKYTVKLDKLIDDLKLNAQQLKKLYKQINVEMEIISDKSPELAVTDNHSKEQLAVTESHTISCDAESHLKQYSSKQNINNKTIPPLPPNGDGDDDSFVLPFFIDPELWEEFIKQRRSSKKPMTAFAKKLAINKLVKMRDEGQDVNEVIKQSIINNWSGFFPIKNMSSKGKEQSYAELLFNAYPSQRQQYSEPVPEVSGYLGREVDE